MVRLIIFMTFLASSFGQKPVEAGNMFEWVYNVIEKLVALRSDNIKQDSKIDELEANLQDARDTIDMLKHSQQKSVISTYVRWGKTECPAEAQKVYGGYAAGSNSGHSGSGANILCLPSQPVWGTYNNIKDPQATLHGVDYKLRGIYDGHEAPCALCSVPRASSVMIPGRNACYDGWKLEYSGYLASTKYDDKRYICLDEHFDKMIMITEYIYIMLKHDVIRCHATSIHTVVKLHVLCAHTPRKHPTTSTFLTHKQQTQSA